MVEMGEAMRLQSFVALVLRGYENIVFFETGICSKDISGAVLIAFRSSRPDVFLGKSILKICSKFTGEHPCRMAISIKLLSNFIEIALRHGCPPVNLLHIFRRTFLKNVFGRLLLVFRENFTECK